jgi:hypothetical protein
MYDWSSAAGARVLFNAVPQQQAMIAGKTVYFTNGSTEALYQVTLP